MADIQDPNNAGEDKHGLARRLADASMRARRKGNGDEAERLMAEATRTDPEAAAEALAETRQGAKLDAAEVTSDEEVAAITRTIQPNSDAPSRAGITGSGSGADG